MGSLHNPGGRGVDGPEIDLGHLPEDHPAHLLAAFALDAVDPSEAVLLEEYLRHDAAAAAEFDAYREVAAWLGHSATPAPEGVWERIVASIEDAPPEPGPDLAKVISVPPLPRPTGQVPSSAGRSRVRWWLASAAAVIVAVAISAVVWSRSPVTDPLQIAVEQLRDDRDVRFALLENAEIPLAVEALIDLKGHGYLLAGDLPRLDRDQTYQLWGVIGDQVISLGLLGPTPAVETFTARGDLVALAITVEAAGGVVSDGNPDGAFSGPVR